MMKHQTKEKKELQQNLAYSSLKILKKIKLRLLKKRVIYQRTVAFCQKRIRLREIAQNQLSKSSHPRKKRGSIINFVIFNFVILIIDIVILPRASVILRLFWKDLVDHPKDLL